MSSARDLAVESLKTPQDQSKERFDTTASGRNFRRGDWVLVKFPSDETGKHRKLSQPWHGPYRVLEQSDTTVRVEKVFRTQHAPLHVHQSRVKFCPLDLPPGYYWYGRKQSCPGRLPQWVENLNDYQTSQQPGQIVDANADLQESPQQPCDADQQESIRLSLASDADQPASSLLLPNLLPDGSGDGMFPSTATAGDSAVTDVIPHIATDSEQLHICADEDHMTTVTSASATMGHDQTHSTSPSPPSHSYSLRGHQIGGVETDSWKRPTAE